MNKHATFFSGIPSNALPWAVAWLLVALQVACGGSDDSSTSPPVNSPISSPVVDVDLSTPVPPLAVGSPAGTAVGITASASDPDPDNNQVSYELLDNAGGLFVIDANSGVVTTSGVLTAAALSAPATVTMHSIIVKAVSADGSSSQGTFTVRVEPANTAPVGPIADANADAPAFTFGQVSVDDPVGVTAQAADPDAFQAVSYTLADNAGGLFGIDESSGEIRFLMVPDAPNEAITLSVTVKATSTDGSSSTATFDITLLPAPAPVTPPPPSSPISSPVVDVDLSTPVPPLAVGSPAGTAVGITASASDPDPDNNQVSYELLEDAGGLFAIDANSGVVTTSGVLTTDALSAPAMVTMHSIIVKAVSADGSSSQGTFTVRVEPANTAPVGAIADADADAPAFTFGQVSADDPVGVTAQAADPDAFHAVSYTLADNAGGLFGIDESSGEIRFLMVPDAPSEAITLSVTVKATSTDGSSSTATFDITLLPAPPDLIVHFPAPLSLTTTNTISFFGTAAPGVVGAGPVTVTVTVGDAEAVVRTVTAEPFAWQVEDLPLETNQTVAVDITAQDAIMGRLSQLEYRVVQSSAVTLGAPVGLVLDAVNGRRLLVADNALDGIVAVELSDGPSNGLRTRFSTDGDGNGPEMTTPSGAMALDSANNRVLLMDSTLDALFAVDLSSGERSVLSSDSTGVGTGFDSSAGLALHPTKPNVALVSDGRNNDVVFEVNLGTGDRTVLSPQIDPTIGSWNTPRDIVAWTPTLALVPTSSDRALFSVNLGTGGRAVVSSASTGTGPGFGTPRFMALRGASHTNRLLITDSGTLDALLSVNLDTGDREVLSGSSGTELVGTGADFSDPRGIALDDGNNIAYVSDTTQDVTTRGIVVKVDLSNGDREVLASPQPPRTLATGPQLTNPRSIALDRSTRSPRLLVVNDGLNEEGDDSNEDERLNAVVEISLTTGERSIVSGGIVGMPLRGTAMQAAAEFIDPRGLGLDGQRALVVDSGRDALLAIDLRPGGTLGDRSVISSDDSVGELDFASPRGRVALLGDGTALVADTSADTLFRVDLATGARSALVTDAVSLAGIQDVAVDRSVNPPRIAITVSSNATLDAVIAISLDDGSQTLWATTQSVGFGPEMTNPRGIAWDIGNERNRLLVMDADLDALIEIELDSGTFVREIVSEGGMLTSTGASNALAVDSANNRAWVISQGNSHVVMVHLLTGAQAIVSE